MTNNPNKNRARMVRGDVLKWARLYRGPKFHALLCDAPYHLYSIQERFGAEDAAPAQGGVYARSSRGFMGKSWDGGDIAMNPETWRAMAQHLYPGAFLFVAAGTLNDDLISAAMRGAGLIKFHKVVYWGYGSGFPKATRIDTQIDRAAGAEVNKGREAPAFAPRGVGYRTEEFANNGHTDGAKHTAKTELAQTWAGHRYGLQALKPAVETILIFRKPYEADKGVPSITKYGAGALNIDAARIGADSIPSNRWVDNAHPFGGGAGNDYETVIAKGRWPANLILGHSPDCKPNGKRQVKSGGGKNPINTGASIGTFEEKETRPFFNYADPDGNETINDWDCAPGCPVAALNDQSGELQSGLMTPDHAINSPWGYGGGQRSAPTLTPTPADSGGASRYFFNADWLAERLELADPVSYFAKAGRAERDAGLENNNHGPRPLGDSQWKNQTNGSGQVMGPSSPARNPHPTCKPISLARHLAALLLPPDVDQYKPRRLLVPFAGVASEMIGAMLAGWDEILGIEREAEYIPIGRARLNWWGEALRWGHSEVDSILKNFESLVDGEPDSFTDETQLSLFSEV